MTHSYRTCICDMFENMLIPVFASRSSILCECVSLCLFACVHAYTYVCIRFGVCILNNGVTAIARLVTCCNTCHNTCHNTCCNTCHNTCRNTCCNTCCNTCRNTCCNTCCNTCRNTCRTTISCVCTHTTGWRRPIGCLKLQVIFRKRATIYRVVLRKMTCKNIGVLWFFFATLYSKLNTTLKYQQCVAVVLQGVAVVLQCLLAAT